MTEQPIEGNEPRAFALHGAREILAFTAGALNIRHQIETLERSVTEAPGLAFDLSKSLIESVCKTILADRGHPVTGTSDLPKLIREVCEVVRLVPLRELNQASQRDSLRKTTQGLITTIQGLCELRRTEGIASHGKDAYSEPLESIQARFVAGAADAVVNLLFKAHKSYASENPSRRLQYEDSVDFNQYVDENNDPVKIFSLTYPPSEVLFNIDQQAYRDVLADYEQQRQEEEGGGS